MLGVIFMKRDVVLLLSFSFLLPPAFGQGPLVPPGPPAPTMKTLDQVEPRKPIGPATFTVTINSPGSYYLAGDIITSNFAHGISITSGDVSLDLNGFTIRKATGAGGNGINVNGAADGSTRNIMIRNGHISGSFDQGVGLDQAHNIAIEDLGIQGTASTGIFTSSIDPSPQSLAVRRCRIFGEPVDRVAGTTNAAMVTAGIYVPFAMPVLIEDCVIANIRGDGIRILTANSGDVTSSGIIRGCVISRCGSDGIEMGFNTATVRGVLIERCTIDQCGSSGINVASSGRILDCVANNNGMTGIRCLSRQMLITGCVAENNSTNGIQVASDSKVINNVCDGNGAALGDGAGILVTGSGCHIEGNTVTDADRGINVTGSGNLIIKNTASGNGTNYDIVVNNRVGVIVLPPFSIAIAGSTGGAGVGTTDPWANFSY